ncbi:GCN5 family acetyltransferase [Methylobacillus sp. MM3]|uniref:GNAT family N-acetyltransferase n=1 Tax=Methylobacillus sp. MM3 TaxID=1848039 RepID=UPI0007E1470B|nr:GNAT family N-acetyltransferase [Methylobacillus sp. MM3]OAJ70221.1 GCN5 family acetyltransferase [Methylobacillus sp. MM3]
MNIRTAITESEIRACYPAMRELRPHLSEEVFVSQVQRQMQNHGYVLIYIAAEGEVMAAAGYRVAEFLAWGKACYLDDLVTLESARKHGYGGMLLDWLMNKAEELGCRQFHLDSGVQRHDAHRLYLGRKMQITSHHFAKALA